VARKGARVLDETPAESAGREREPKKGRPSSGRRPLPRDEVWVFEEVVEDAPTRGRRARSDGPTPEAASAHARPGTRPARSGASDSVLPSEVVNELAAAVGQDHATRLSERMAAAARAYERDRYTEAFRITKQLADQVPESAAARELHGLVCYRLGRWTQAIGHLEAARKLDDDDTSQLPVMMDCHRALHRHRRVAALWEELRASSPSPDILAEGRMVLASDLADQRKLNAAVEVLATAGAARNLRHPSDRHVRQWYVLADLYERAGDAAHARELFGRVAAADPELADAADRYAALGSRTRRPRTSGRAAAGRTPALGKPAGGAARASGAAGDDR
jgi:tetratricopeptide (TPR) repeat protein